MSWINFGGFRGGPAATSHGHVPHDPGNSTGTGGATATAASPNEAASATSTASTASTAAAGGELELQRSRDIKKNLIHCAELKKHNTRFYSEVLRKKFFVLYEDSRRSVTNPRDHTANAGSNEDQRPSDEDDEGYEPARLEYYNNQRNWEAGEQPRRVIILRDVFTITRKRDTRESIHKYVIAIYTVEDYLGIVFDTEEIMKTWLEMLISCQMGGRSIEGRIPKPKYDYVYGVDVQHFEPEFSSNSFQMSGPYRMVITNNDVKLFAVGLNKPVCFLISSIRGCSISKANRRMFKLEIGRSSESGSGVLVMKCNDEEISDNIRAAMYDKMRALSESNTNSTTSSRHRPRTSNMNSNNIRIRTHSWSNMDKSKSFRAASSAKPITVHHQHKSSTAAFLDRHRTTSEGNTHFDLKRSLPRGGKSITSGSPMSPGSFVSSESAGSSNSLDETDDNRIVTPIDDHMGPATIFEESSAESCVEQHNSSSSNYFKNPNPTESRLADSISNEQGPQSSSLTSAASTVTPANQGSDINVNYTPIDILSSTSGYTITGASSNLMASSPPGTSVHYSTILMDANAASLLQVADHTKLITNQHRHTAADSKEATQNSSSYMIMSPQGTSVAEEVSLNCKSKSSSSFSSNELQRHKPLSGLLADHDFESADTGSAVSSVTSPVSQSSYNPLLDEVQTDDSSAYMVMSPASGTTSGMGTAPRKTSHQRCGSNPSKTMIPASEDYVDMSPAGSAGGSKPGGVPIPIRNMSSTSLSFGTSPSAALTSHLVSFGDQPPPGAAGSGGAAGGPLRKTPEDSPYLVMSPVDPEAKDFSLSRRSTPPVKQRTASIDSTGTGSGSGTSLSISRQKTGAGTCGGRGRFYRGQSDSQRSSLCFDDHWDLGISPQESSGGTLMGPPSEAGTEPLDYAPLELTRARTISKAELDSLQPVAAVSRLRLDNEEPLDLDIADVEDVHHGEHGGGTGSNTISGSGVGGNNLVTNPRAYSVGCRPPSLLTGSSSSVSTTGSGSSHHHSRHKSRFIDIPGATTASGTSGTGTGSQASSFSPGTALLTGQSPSSMAARLTGWIRHRTGSVPSKSAISGRRRHRTQSEGEKDEI